MVMFHAVIGIVVFSLTQAQRTESAKLAAKMPPLTKRPHKEGEGKVATKAVRAGPAGDTAFSVT